MVGTLCSLHLALQHMDFLLGYTTGSICEIRKEDMDANRGCICR